MSILLIAEHDHKHLKPVMLSVIRAASELPGEIIVLVAGHQCAAVATEVAKVQGVQQVLLVDAPEYAHLLPENLAPLITQLLENVAYVLAPATAFGKNLLPRVAGLLGVAQISDVIKIVAPDTFVRPIYAGNALATVQAHDAVKLLTIRTTAYSAAEFQQKPAAIKNVDLVIKNTATEWISQAEPVSKRAELTNARVVIAGGRGLGSAENFKLLEKIADKLNAALGASRAAVDAGFVPNDWQVGQTGKIVAPDLYMAVGISGAIQHVAGMKDSKVIVAINQDPDAAIFQIADYGLVGNLFEILPELEKLL
jgi:electron transfer flavoprotein alpha subunit